MKNLDILAEMHPRQLKPKTDPPWWIVIAVIITILLLCPLLVRADMLAIAQSQIGLGEIGGNNRGHYVRQYLNGKENLPWCAGFVSYCAQKSGNKIKYTLRAKDFLKLGKKVTKPKAGDLIIFSRQGGGGHVEIISKINKNNIWTIGGNVGDYPAKIREFKYNKNCIPKFLAFIRIEGN